MAENRSWIEECEPFTVDHARMLAQRICAINQQRGREVEDIAKTEGVPHGAVSMRMSKVYGEWHDEIYTACDLMLKYMSDEINHHARLNSDLLSTVPAKPLLMQTGTVKDE